MKKGDFLWIAVLGIIVTFFIYPDTNKFYITQNTAHPYVLGFIKFFVLASMGEILSLRIVEAKWNIPSGLYLRALIWGVLGVAIVLVFKIYPFGIDAVIKKGLLPDFGLQGQALKILMAFYISAVMNLTFAPVMMGVHRITDTFIDLYYKNKKMPTMNIVLDTIRWKDFVSFVVFTTIPLFWIPAHTITFSLPAQYQVLMAAMLSIALGSILAFAKKRNIKA